MVSLISIYIIHTYMMLVSICSYCRHISVVGFEVQLLQTHTCLLFAAKFSYADRCIVFRATELPHDVINSFVEVKTGLNIFDLQFAEAYIGLYFHTVNFTLVSTKIHRPEIY